MLQLEAIGNLGSDAEIKIFGERKYVSFSLAHSERHKDGNSETVWVNVLWYGDGGNLLQYLTKGTKLFVRGRFAPKAYTDNSGQPRCSVNVYATEVSLCGSRNDSNAANNQQQQHTTATAPQPVPQPTAAPKPTNPEQELPF